MSKGSNPRPIPDRDKYEDNWDKIFNKPKEEDEDGEDGLDTTDDG